MNRRTRLFRIALPVATAFALSLGASTFALAQSSPTQSSGGHGGVGRQGNGQPLRVTVLLHDKPIASAHIVITTADGTVILRGLTRANGVFTTNSLDQGTYTVTATTTRSMATTPVAIVTSTDPALVSLTLQPKTPPAP